MIFNFQVTSRTRIFVCGVGSAHKRATSHYDEPQNNLKLESVGSRYFK